jgi:hypothetical protein
VWDIDLMGPFPISFGFSYILLAVYYVYKWVEAKATRTNDARVVVDFVRSHIFCRFGIPRDIVSNQGTHICNKSMQSMLKNMGSFIEFLHLTNPGRMGKLRFQAVK